MESVRTLVTLSFSVINTEKCIAKWVDLCFKIHQRWMNSWPDDQVDCKSMTRKFRNVKAQELAGCLKLWFPGGLHPWRSNNICIITLSQHRLCAGPSHLPENTPLHSCSSCSSPSFLSSSPFLLSTMHRSSYAHLHRPGSDYQPISEQRNNSKESKKKKKNCRGGNCSLTPCSDSSGSALTRTAGIPSSINILFLRLPVNGHRRGIRWEF